MDNTYKVSGKATVVAQDGKNVKLLKGGVLSAINEQNEIVTWVSNPACRMVSFDLKAIVLADMPDVIPCGSSGNARRT